MKRFITYSSLFTLLFFLCFFFFAKDTFASEELDFVPCQPAEVLGLINREKKVVINGESNTLFCEFEDRDKAMQTLKERIPEYLEELAKNNNLEELNNSNWKEYDIALRQADYPPTTEEGRLLSVFIGTYESNTLNEKVVKYVSSRKGSLNKYELEEVAPMLPYFSKVAVTNNRRKMLENETRKNRIMAVNMASARTYASNYSWSQNSAYRYFPGADCTNYVSQILANSGISQTSNWWYNMSNHTYSTSWVNTPAFANTMGVGMSYGTNHFNFSRDIQDGDVILLDSDRNGSWDHAGFVTYQNSSPANYSNGYYYNYMVTQHSSNYYRWANENGNGWPISGGNYGRSWGF